MLHLDFPDSETREYILHGPYQDALNRVKLKMLIFHIYSEIYTVVSNNRQTSIFFLWMANKLAWYHFQKSMFLYLMLIFIVKS